MPKRFKKFYKRRTAEPRRRFHAIHRASKKPLFFVPVLTFAVLAGVVVGGLSILGGGQPKLSPNGSNNIVLIRYDKQERTIPTRAKTVGDLLKRLHLTLNPGDIVEPSKDTEILGDNFRVNVYRAVPVTIVDGAQKTFTYSAAATPRSIARQLGMTVYPEDRLDLLPTENFLTEGSIGERVVISRSYPVALDIYGKAVPSRTLATTVGGLLEEKNIKLHHGDSVFPDAKTPLTPGTQVYLLNKDTKVESSEEPIAAPLQKVNDNTLTFGVTAVRQKGAPGKKLVTYRVDKDGQKTVIQEVLVQPPVAQIEATGTYFDIAKSKTAVMGAAGIASSSYVYADFVIEHESHWNPGSLNSHGCAGLGQACPGSKLAAACPNWRSDPVCQMRFFTQYALGRYGSWASAYNHKRSYGWW